MHGTSTDARTPMQTHTQTQTLRALVALVETGSVTAAAVRLGCSQPTASRLLMRLRQVFGDPLLVRSGARMLPTPRARELAAEAQDLLGRLQRFMSPPARFHAASSADTFVVSMPEYLEHLLCPALQRLVATEAPQATLCVKPPAPLTADQQLEAGDIDLRLGWVRSPSPSMRSCSLYSERFIGIVRDGHPLLEGEVTVQRYAGFPHVRHQASVPSTASRLMEEAVRRAGARMHVALVVPSYLTIARVLADTDLVATVPAGIGRSLLADRRLRTVPSPLKIPPLRAAMYWHDRFQADPRHRWLRSLVQKAVAGAGLSSRGADFA